jgi:hypothetical protein
MGLYDARPCPCGSGLLSSWEFYRPEVVGADSP